MDMYGASHKLPSVLFDPVKTRSYSPRETAFQESVGTKLTLWEYFEEPIRQLDGTLKLRPDVEIFNLAMVGGGRVHEPPLFAGMSIYKHTLIVLVSPTSFRLSLGRTRVKHYRRCWRRGRYVFSSKFSEKRH